MELFHEWLSHCFDVVAVAVFFGVMWIGSELLHALAHDSDRKVR